MENQEAKPILNCSVETIIKVDYNDLDDFVQKFTKYSLKEVKDLQGKCLTEEEKNC